MLSVTEGDDKPAKYPFLFRAANLVVVTKVDLLGSTDFSLERASSDILALNRDQMIISVSSGDESSVQQVVDWLLEKCRATGSGD